MGKSPEPAARPAPQPHTAEMVIATIAGVGIGLASSRLPGWASASASCSACCARWWAISAAAVAPAERLPGAGVHWRPFRLVTD